MYVVVLCSTVPRRVYSTTPDGCGEVRLLVSIGVHISHGTRGRECRTGTRTFSLRSCSSSYELGESGDY